MPLPGIDYCNFLIATFHSLLLLMNGEICLGVPGENISLFNSLPHNSEF